MLDLACGAGRHALAAAMLGAEVTAVDRDPSRLAIGRDAARDLGLSITWLEWDLTGAEPPLGTFDTLLLFNYLDRDRLARMLQHLRPGGVLLMETFLEDQREFDWGPTSAAHLLRRGELASLVAPLRILHGREVLEPANGNRWSAVASIVAHKL